MLLKGLQTLTCLIKGHVYLKRSTMPNMFIMVSVLSNFYLALPVSYYFFEKYNPARLLGPACLLGNSAYVYKIQIKLLQPKEKSLNASFKSHTVLNYMVMQQL